LPGSAEVEK